MRRLVILAFILITAIAPAVSAEPSQPAIQKQAEQPNMAIHTYGGGELLEKVFNSVSMLIYGNSTTGIGKFFNGIIRLALIIGGFACICAAYSKGSLQPIIHNFFLTSLGVISLLVPRSTVYIKDHMAQVVSTANMPALRKVENVPFAMGMAATWMSELSYLLTKGLESVSHGVNDSVYNWTGHIYAGNDLLQAKKCRISNPTLEDNFREFCRECAFRDIGIGLYSKDELVHAKNLLKFLEERTSNIRTVMYKEPSEKNVQGTYIPCKQAMKKMNEIFDKKENGLLPIVLGETSSDLGLLLGQKKLGEQSLQKLLRQQAAIELIKEELPGGTDSFAVKRAELQQQSSQKILGALGARGVVAMRNFFEATIYMVFPLMIIVALLSFGIKPILSWIQFGIWINMWPIFYIVVNFLLTTVWNFRKKLLCGSGSLDLTVFTSEGLVDLYSSIEAMAAMALSLIPFLSWVLLRGGVSQMVHMASSMTGPAQAAAGAAASEQITGNYSYGNVSHENTNAYNAQTFKQSYSGMLSHGSVGIDSGSQTMTHASDTGQLFVRQSDTYLREGISRTEAFSSSLQESLTNSESAVLDASTGVSTAVNESSNRAAGLVGAISRHMQTGENFNIQDSSSAQQAFNAIYSTAQEYSNATGLSMDASIKELASAGINTGLAGSVFGLKAGVEGAGHRGVSDYENYGAMQKAMDSNQFQEHLQTVRNLSSSEVSSILGSEDAKYHEDFVQSLNQVDSSSDQLRAAHAKQTALSDLQSYSESESVTFHQNLNQQFVDFLGNKFDGDASRISSALNSPNDVVSKQALIHEFVDDYLPSMVDGEAGLISGVHKQNATALNSDVGAHFDQNLSALSSQATDRIGHTFGDIEKRSLKEAVSADIEGNQMAVYAEADNLANSTAVTSSGAQSHIDRGLISNAQDHLASGKIVNKALDMHKKSSREFHRQSAELHKSWFEGGEE